jgi:hypothetical protein
MIEKKMSPNQWSYKKTLATKVWGSGRKEGRLAERSEAGENEMRVAERRKAKRKWDAEKRAGWEKAIWSNKQVGHFLMQKDWKKRWVIFWFKKIEKKVG